MSGWAAAPPGFAPATRVHRATDAAGAAWLISVAPDTGDTTIEAAPGNPRDPDSLSMAEEDRLYAQIPPAPPPCDEGPDFGLDLVLDEDDRVQLCGLDF